MKRIFKNSNVKGVSLIEFLVAFALLAVVIMPLTSLFLSAAVINKKARNTLDYSSVSRQIRTEVLEAYKNGNKLYKYNFNDNSVLDKSIDLPANDNEKKTDIGIVHLGYNKLYPNLKYSITKVPGIFTTPALNSPAIANSTPEIKIRADLFQKIDDGAEIASQAKFSIVQSFYIMVPKEYNLNSRN